MPIQQNVKHARKKRGLCLAAAFVLLALGLDPRLQCTRYEIMDLRLPAALDGFTVVHLSDLHGSIPGFGQETLVAAIKNAQPDLIVLTGDIIDRKDTDLSAVESLLDGIGFLCPIYSVTGNHEEDNRALLAKLHALYAEKGVQVLSNEAAEVKYNDATIYVGGMRYGAIYNEGSLRKLSGIPSGAFGILLYHAATHYEDIVSFHLPYGYVFSGHTHGGIIRIPLLGGVIDNNFNIFPRYAGGLYDGMKPAMVCSRGLGNSSGVPLPRFNNRPELVVVTFRCVQ